MASSSEVRVLPIPGSPTSIRRRPRPESASSSPALSSSISFSRPTKTPPANRSSGFASASAVPPTTVLAVSIAALRASGSAAALSGRSSGFFARQRRMRDSSARGTSGLCQVGATGAVLMCWEMIATASSPRKGGRPATIS